MQYEELYLSRFEMYSEEAQKAASILLTFPNASLRVPRVSYQFSCQLVAFSR